jgi:tRNA modification GTPase
MQFPDTIFALSSGKPPSGVAVIRVSGPKSRDVVEAVAGKAPPDRKAALRTFRARHGEIIDRGLVLFFGGPASFTGEDCAEFHLHGGRAVVSAMAEALSGFERVRPAEAGEFTRRAFLNGKMDLVEAEALADLVAAETEQQRRFAFSGAGGAQSTLYAGWRKRIIHARAMIEAELDFAEEGDVPGSVAAAVWDDVRRLVAQIEVHLASFHRAEIIREGYSVVIAGPPNAGKSSLLNALARRDVAIVTEEPGTTRDLVHVALDLGGMKVVVTDTAGIREGAGRVEVIGIERTLESVRHADLVLVLEDVVAPAAFALPPIAGAMLKIGSKADLIDAAARTAGSGYDLVVSAKSGAGVDQLLTMISQRAAAAVGDGGGLIPARARHVALLREASISLARAANDGKGALEFRAEELRRAGDSFGRIAGTVDVEEVLGAIFSEFCIGK